MKITRNYKGTDHISCLKGRGMKCWFSAGMAGLMQGALLAGNLQSGETTDLNLKGENTRMNVIFIMADDMGWSDLGCYGSDLHETPVIDRLAEEGMRFTNAYSAAAICTPTRAALMTGKYPAKLNMTIWHEYAGEAQTSPGQKLVGPATEKNLSLHEYSLAKAFKDDGYFTAHVGKWHLGDAIHYPEAHGFDINIGGNLWGMPFSFWYPFSGWREIDGEYRYVPGLEKPEGGNENTYLTDRLTDEAIRIIEARKNQDFFLNLSYYSPHVPLEGKPDYVDYFSKKANAGSHHQNPVYAAMIASIDENVGRILTKLEELGIAGKTLLVFYSDNGGLEGPRVNRNNNFPLRSGKGSLYEGGIRVPLIIKWPGVVTPGAISHVPVITMDFYPTLQEIAGIKGNKEQNEALDGHSLVPLLHQTEDQWNREMLFWHYPHYYQQVTAPVSAVRKEEWKLIHHLEDDRLELFNLHQDPGEAVDVSERYPEHTTELYHFLQQWRSKMDAKMPSQNPEYKPVFWE